MVVWIAVTSVVRLFERNVAVATSGVRLFERKVAVATSAVRLFERKVAVDSVDNDVMDCDGVVEKVIIVML